MSSAEFPLSIAAIRAFEDHAKKGDEFQWAIADAVFEECGRPGPNGVNNGSDERLQRLAGELKKAGLKGHSFQTLRKYRQTAAKFRPINRLPGVSFWAHAFAGGPETLQAAKRQAEDEGKELTARYVQGFKQRQRRERHKREREANDKLRDQPQADFDAEDAVTSEKTWLADLREQFDQRARSTEARLGRLNSHQRREIAGAYLELAEHMFAHVPFREDSRFREAAE